MTATNAQVREMMEEFNRHGRVGIAAMRSIGAQVDGPVLRQSSSVPTPGRRNSRWIRWAPVAKVITMSETGDHDARNG